MTTMTIPIMKTSTCGDSWTIPGDDPDHWSHQPRTCGLCGGQDIPRAVDWPWWVDGKPAHGLCVGIVELVRLTKERRARLMVQSTLYRLCVFSERMKIITP